jgi:hypothetical protein
MEKKDFDAAGASAIHCAPSMLGKAGKASSCTVQWENLFSYLSFSNFIVLLPRPAFAGLEFSVLSSDMSVFSVPVLDQPSLSQEFLCTLKCLCTLQMKKCKEETYFT